MTGPNDRNIKLHTLTKRSGYINNISVPLNVEILPKVKILFVFKPPFNLNNDEFPQGVKFKCVRSTERYLDFGKDKRSAEQCLGWL